MPIPSKKGRGAAAATVRQSSHFFCLADGGQVLDQDEYIKADSTAEQLAKLKPAFKKARWGRSHWRSLLCD